MRPRLINFAWRTGTAKPTTIHSKLGCAPEVRQENKGQATVRRKKLGERNPVCQNERGWWSAGGHCWRATRRGI